MLQGRSAGMLPEDLLELAGSPTRLKLIQLLSERPRSLAELAEGLKVTPQAVLKHLRALEERRVVRTLSLERPLGGLVRQLYALMLPIEVARDADADAISVHIHAYHGRPSAELLPKRAKASRQTLLKHLEELRDERRALARRLRAVREKEDRLFREGVELQRIEAKMIEEARCNPLEEVLLKAFLHPRAEDELGNIARHLKVSQEKIRRLLEQYGPVEAQ